MSLVSGFLADLSMSTFRLAVPLVFAAYGGLLSERSGIANIALEAYLLASAFSAATVTTLTGSLVLGTAAGIFAAALVGLFFAVTCIWGKGDQIVIGTAFNFLAAGLIPVLTKGLFGVTGSTPAIAIEQRYSEPLWFLLIAVLLTVVLYVLFAQTKHGIRITAAGENPTALETQGVSFRLVRLRAVVEGAALAGLGGVYLSLCQGSGYVRDMAAGRGFIALAALIFGAWKPIPTFLACLFFGMTDAIQMQLQGQHVGGFEVPNQFVQMIPYAATLFVLVVFARKISAPAAINSDPR